MKIFLIIIFLFPAFEFHAIPTKNKIEISLESATLFKECGLEGVLDFKIFERSMTGFKKYSPKKSLITIIDYTLPSDQKRFFVIDLKKKCLLQQTWVAHGKKSGLIMATDFSNKLQSYQSSPGFYKVGSIITSPKHGPAIQLIGLEKGLNDNAQKREIIMHGAWYVGEEFVKKNGRCGRSHGCPAVAPELISVISPILADGSLLYIHIKSGKEA